MFKILNVSDYNEDKVEKILASPITMLTIADERDSRSDMNAQNLNKFFNKAQERLANLNHLIFISHTADPNKQPMLEVIKEFLAANSGRYLTTLDFSHMGNISGKDIDFLADILLHSSGAVHLPILNFGRMKSTADKHRFLKFVTAIKGLGYERNPLPNSLAGDGIDVPLFYDFFATAEGVHNSFLRTLTICDVRGLSPKIVSEHFSKALLSRGLPLLLFVNNANIQAQISVAQAMCRRMRAVCEDDLKSWRDDLAFRKTVKEKLNGFYLFSCGYYESEMFLPKDKQLQGCHTNRQHTINLSKGLKDQPPMVVKQAANTLLMQGYRCAEVYAVLAKAGLDMNDYDQAVSGARIAFGKDPLNILALKTLLKALYQLKRFSESLEYFNRLLEIQPWNVVALSEKAYALQELSLVSKRELDYRRTIECSLSALYKNNILVRKPLDQKVRVKLLIGLAESYKTLKRFDASIFYVDQALGLDPTNCALLILKGSMIRNEDASKMLELWLPLLKSQKLVGKQALEAYLEIAKLFFIMRRDSGALDYLRQAEGSLKEEDKEVDSDLTTFQEKLTSILEGISVDEEVDQKANELLKMIEDLQKKQKNQESHNSQTPSVSAHSDRILNENSRQERAADPNRQSDVTLKNFSIIADTDESSGEEVINENNKRQRPEATQERGEVILEPSGVTATSTSNNFSSFQNENNKRERSAATQESSAMRRSKI